VQPPACRSQWQQRNEQEIRDQLELEAHSRQFMRRNSG
jgi:hypothetical protein